MAWKSALKWHSVSTMLPDSTSVKWGSRVPRPVPRMPDMPAGSAAGRNDRMALHCAGARDGSAPRNRSPSRAGPAACGSSSGNSHLGAARKETKRKRMAAESVGSSSLQGLPAQAPPAVPLERLSGQRVASAHHWQCPQCGMVPNTGTPHLDDGPLCELAHAHRQVAARHRQQEALKCSPRSSAVSCWYRLTACDGSGGRCGSRIFPHEKVI